eukprot:scaffold54810_cov15-Tisochrysis_lutea.AAC.1
MKRKRRKKVARHLCSTPSQTSVVIALSLFVNHLTLLLLALVSDGLLTLVCVLVLSQQQPQTMIYPHPLQTLVLRACPPPAAAPIY